jgi:hypothetical protein
MHTSKYRVYHSEEGVPKVERAMPRLSAAQIEREIEHLPTALYLHFKGSSIEAETVPVAGNAQSAVVTLESNLSKEDMERALLACVNKINARIAGLCLLFEKIGS